MAKTEPRSKVQERRGRKSRTKDRQLSRELEMSFPASDPPAATQPGSGITGPEAASSQAGADKRRINRRVHRSSAVRSRVRQRRAAIRNPAETSEGVVPPNPGDPTSRGRPKSL